MENIEDFRLEAVICGLRALSLSVVMILMLQQFVCEEERH